VGWALEQGQARVSAFSDEGGGVNIFSKLFGAGPEAAEKVLDAGIRGLDALVFTNEEKSAARQKLSDTWLETQKVLQAETSIRSVTRRIIAFAVIFPFVALIMFAAGVYPWRPEYSKFLIDLAQGQFGWLVVTVATFYFGPMVGRIFETKK
jgi:hypothetical protein